MTPEAELQLAQHIAAHGKRKFISAFLGFSEGRFGQVHTTGLLYLGATVLFACFAPVIAVLCGSGFVIYYLSLPLAAGRYAGWLSKIERKYGLLGTAPATEGFLAQDDDAFYGAVAKEIEQGHVDKTGWTRAVAESVGDEKLAKSLYIRYRVRALQVAHGQRARQLHEAQALEQARAKVRAQQVQAAQTEQESQKARENNQGGCLAMLAGVIGLVVFLGIVGNSGEHPQPAASATLSQSAPVQAPPSTPSYAERQAALDQKYAELNAEYLRLADRRANLRSGDRATLAAFNRDAAEYTRRSQETDAEKVRLNQGFSSLEVSR